MTRIQFTIAFFLTFLLFGCSNSPDKSRNIEERPNILFLAIDDLKPELNFYGANHIHSPNLDKLSKESTIFERAYCNIPTCGASRASLMTGIRPTRHRFITYNTSKDKEAPDIQSLPMTFKKNGYRTISNGKVYHLKQDDSQAWDEIWRPEIVYNDYALSKNQDLITANNRGPAFESAEIEDDCYADGKIASKGIEDLRKLKNSKEPFFLALGFKKPHLPFNAPKKYWDLYQEENIQFPENYVQPKSTPSIAFHKFGELRTYDGIPGVGADVDDDLARKLIHGYYACVSYVDEQVGRVLKELERLDLADNTIIVLWGDHGWNLGNHKIWCKHSTFESSLRTSLMIKVPGKKTSRKSDQIVEYIDIFPSLCELAGIEAPAHLEGESLVPLIEGEEDKRKKKYAVAKFKDAIAFIEGDMFYTEWINDKGEMRERMLFDHDKDALELDNLAEKEEYKGVVSQLSQELRRKWGKDFLKKPTAQLIGNKGDNQKPNIIFYLADDQDIYDYGCYGNKKVNTSAVDQLAREGMIFSNAFTGQAICTPSRSQLFTGNYPFKNGSFANHTKVKGDSKSIAKYMREQGYEVILAGKSHVRPGSVFKWDREWEPVKKEALPREYIPLDSISKYFATASKPFCMFITSKYPHGKYFDVPSRSAEDLMFFPFNEKKKGDEGFRKTKSGYYRSIEEDNTQLELVLQSVDQYLDDNTLFIYSADHGVSGKFTVYDRGLHVPFVARWPNMIKAGSKSSQLIHYTDVLPTLIEIAGGSPPEGIDGKSFLRILKGDDEKIHDYVYGVQTNQNIQRTSIFPSRMIRDKRYKYIRNFNSYEVLDQNLGENEVVNEFIRKGALKFKNIPFEELYDIEADPFEQINLAKSVEHDQIKNEMVKNLYSWMNSQGDFLSKKSNGMPIITAPLFKLDQETIHNPVPDSLQNRLTEKDYFPIAHWQKE